MTGPGERADELSIWRRWRPAAHPADELDADEAALLLASHAEGRLGEAAAAAIEDWLVDHPEALTDLAVARLAEENAAETASEAVVARAAALVAATGDNVVRFTGHGSAGRSWRSAMAWSGLAASVLATSLVGFALGNDAYSHIATTGISTESAIHDLLDPPTGLFTVEDEDSAT